MSGVAIISRSHFDLATLSALSREMLGYSPSKIADNSPQQLSPVAHNLVCLAAFRDKEVKPSVEAAEHCFGLVSIGFLVAVKRADLNEVLEALKGVETIVTDTVENDVQTFVVNGTLAQWRRVIKLACQSTMHMSRNARHVFNSMYKQLVSEGLKGIFEDMKVVQQNDHTFLLEDKR